MADIIKNGTVSVGVVSRLDIGGDGTRLGLVTAGFDLLAKEGADFIVIAGGLVDRFAIDLAYKQEILELRERLKGKSASSEEISAAVIQFRTRFIDKWADTILKAIPEMKKPDGECNSISIITSRYYDGKTGQEIAYRMAEKRNDIRYRGQKFTESFELRHGVGKWMAVLVPQKAPWRGKYYATAAQREVEDYIRSISKPIADFLVVGCLGSSLFKPKGGESSCPYFTVPVLSKIREVKTSENQIGVRLFRAGSDNSVSAVTYNFKDLVTSERRSIRIQPQQKLTKDQRRVVDLVIESGEKSVNSIIEELNLRKDSVLRNLESLQKRMPKRLYFNEASQRFDFSPVYLQEGLRYEFPDPAKLQRETIVSFGCMHAGHVELSGRFVVEDMPRILLEKNATVLAGVGDFVCGLAHNLMLQDEVYGGMTESRHQRYAAFLVSQPMLRVFWKRFSDALAAEPAARQNQERLREIAAASLMEFWWIPGNHCAWVAFAGQKPLEVFRARLVDLLSEGIRDFFEKNDLFVKDIRRLVLAHIFEGGEQKLPLTKLGVYMCHPSMGRTLTISIRPQQVLSRVDAKKAHIALVANFHVGMALEEWRPGIGQRVVQEVGTLLNRTKFEDSKIKDCDTHFGSLTVWVKDGRIWMSEAAFYEPTKEESPLDNERILTELESRYTAPIPMLPAAAKAST